MNNKTRPLNRGVAMVGAGMSKFGAFKDKTSRDLFVEAFKVDNFALANSFITDMTKKWTSYWKSAAVTVTR